MIHDDRPLQFEKIDLSALPAAQRELETQRLLTEKPRTLYTLESAPGIRVALLKLSSREHVLVLMMHHIICDWSSEGIIWRELSALYRSLIGGQKAALPPLDITHGDYAAWQQKQIADEDFAADLAFWEEKLRDAPALLEVPADRVRPAVLSYRGGRLRWRLGGAMTAKLRRTSQQEKVSLFTIFAAALNTLLYRYTGSDDILLGIPLADRDQQELQSVIGFLLHTHVLRTKIAGSMSFRELLGSVQKGALELYAHRAAPFDQIVRRLGQERSPGHTPLFQVMLNWRDRDQQLSFIGMDGLAVESLMAHSNTAKFDLLLFATDEGEEIGLEMEYNADLFDEDRIARMLGHFETVLESATTDPSQAVSHVEILPAAERNRVLHEWNDAAAPDHSDTFVHRLVEAQAARTPGATALVFEDVPMSYVELNAQANRLAHYLRELGVKPDARVAVCAERSFEMVIALLAILKAGGAYVPLDPAYPAERLRFTIEDAEPVVLLTQTHLRNLFSAFYGTLPVIDLAYTDLWSLMPASDPDPGDLGLTPQHLAYVIYTSGSTGKPKGVMVEHANVLRLFTATNAWFRFSADDVWTLFHSYAFDFSVWEIWGALSYGGRLIVVPKVIAQSPEDFYALVCREKVTVLNQTPSAFRQLIIAQSRSQEPHRLRYVIFGGEALEVATLEPWYKQNRKQRTQLINMYGITETTVHVTYRPLERSDTQRRGGSPIGRRIPDLQIYILDAQGEPAPVGVPGELYIGGAGVARGYLNRPELTAEKFLADPFSSDPKARMYRTGDLGRWMPDGDIEFLGRNDFQVKIRGFRIELGEIENELLQHAGVQQCVVTVQGGDAEKRLVAYLVPGDTKSAPSVEDLRATLQLRLPNYMVPSIFAFIDEIPLTPNGKTDIKKLMQSEVRAAQRETPTEAPRDEVETRLVQIWERVLDVQPIGIRNNFFDVGGYSLMIMKLFTQINKAFDRSLPIATIFRYPTIEQLATLIRGNSIECSALVPLRAQGTKPPLFIVHSYLTYERFRRVIEEDRPLYGLHEREDDDERIASVHERVEEYARLIRETQHDGPYYLIGWCASGPMTVEIARKLQERGGKIAMLGLIDAAHPRYVAEMRRERANRAPWTASRIGRLPSAAARAVPAHGKDALLCRRDSRDGGRQGAACDIAAMASPCSGFAPGWGFQIPRSVDHLAAVRIENSEPYPGKITLFRPLETNQAYRDPALGWRELATEGVDVVWTPGNHETMFLDGNVEKFGQLVQEVMDPKSSHGEIVPKESAPALHSVSR